MTGAPVAAPVTYVPKFAKVEKLGTKVEGRNVFVNIDGKEAWMPWPVAQLLINNLAKAVGQAKQNDPMYHQKLAEIAESGRH